MNIILSLYFGLFPSLHLTLRFISANKGLIISAAVRSHLKEAMGSVYHFDSAAYNLVCIGKQSYIL
jgi:hypothetical protein